MDRNPPMNEAPATVACGRCRSRSGPLAGALAGLLLTGMAATAPAAQPAPRLVIHGEAGASGVLFRADQLAMLLTSQSLGAVEARFVPIAIDTASIRYFHPEDRAIAQTVAELLDGVPTPATIWRIGDFTHYRPLPRPGTVEVWLPPL